MKSVRLTIMGALLVSITLVLGCSSPYVITQDLENPAKQGVPYKIGNIVDMLPDDMAADEKPTIEHIDKFRELLIEQLQKQDLCSEIWVEDGDAGYQIDGTILKYTKGSGFIRFLFGSLGAAKLTVSMQLTDLQDGEIVFAGNFIGTVTSYMDKGDKVFEQVAKNFAKQIRIRSQRIIKKRELLEKQKQKEMEKEQKK